MLCNYCISWLYNTLQHEGDNIFNHFPIVGHFTCFEIFSIINDKAINISKKLSTLGSDFLPIM